MKPFGNAIISKKPNREDLEDRWCVKCLEYTYPRVEDQSYDDARGYVTNWVVLDECGRCEETYTDEEPEEEDE